VVSGSVTAPSFIGGVMPAYTATSGQWFPYYKGTYLALTPVQNRLYAVPVFIDRVLTVDRIAARVQTGGSGGAGVFRLGIYGATDGLPDSLILDAGTIDAISTGVQEITISQSLSPGLHFMVLVQQVTSNATTRSHQSDAIYQIRSNSSSALESTGLGIVGYTVNNITGALPSSFGTPSATTATPDISMRVL
jgi:hypothetical protein